uniref:Uncharacterized protein n=1 Tax=Meloidogyne javanica TaxID=6303 RepID=A0A915LKZ4_MELJA
MAKEDEENQFMKIEIIEDKMGIIEKMFKLYYNTTMDNLNKFSLKLFGDTAIKTLAEFYLMLKSVDGDSGHDLESLRNIINKFEDSAKAINEIKGMKIKLRKIMPQLMFPWLEMQKPIIFRLGKTENFLYIMESSYKFELYKIIFSNNTEEEKREKAVIRIEIAYVFENLFKLEKDNLPELSSFWDKYIKTNEPDRNKIELLQQYWSERWEEQWNNSDHGKQTSKLVTISQPNNLYLIEKHAVAIKLLIVHFDKFRQLYRQRGSKSQIIQLFELDYNKINSILELKNVKTLKTMDDLVFALLTIDKSKEKLFEWLYEDYVQALDSENNEERNSSIASSAIILNILCKGKEDCLDIVKEGFLNDKIQELFGYNQSTKDQTEQNKLLNDLKTELDKSIDSLDKTDQNNNKLEDIEDFREFINYGHNWVIKNLINPKFQEKIKDTRGLERLEALEYMNIDSEYTNDSEYYNVRI